MARRRRRGISVALPWEQRGAWLRQLVTGRRWKFVLLTTLVALGVVVAARAAEQRQRQRETRAAISETKRAIASFRADMGRCPRNLNELIHPPRTARPYLRGRPVDGWGRTLWVRCPGRYDPEGADVVSAGPNGDFLSDDNLE